jgi:hypothetical protein
MESTAAIFTAAANARSMIVIPVASAATALPSRFAWRAAAGNVPTSVGPCLGEEKPAVHADQARERPRLTLPAGLDDWLDDAASGCG